MKKKLLGLVIGATLLLTGCGTPKLKNGEELVAKIDGLEVSANDIYNKMKEKNGTTALLELIDGYIANKEIPTDDAVNKEIDSQINYYKLQFEDFNATLLQYGFESEAAFRVALVDNYKKTKVVEDYYKSLITDKEVEKYYNEEFSGKMDVRHILIQPEEKTDDAGKADADKAALDKANALITKLNEGADFATLAKENSADSSKENGGLIENVTKSGFVEEFYTASLALKNNEYTKTPVKTKFGYHIILKVSSSEKPALDKSKAEIVSTLANKIISEDESASQVAWSEIRKKYNLNINDKLLKSVYNSSIDALKKWQ